VPLADRHHVGESLARVRAVGEAVQHGDVRVCRELLDVGLRVRPDHDRVEVARQHERRVADRLAAPELEVGGREVERRPAQLRHPDLEGDARPRRRLLEDHPEHPTREQLVRLPLALRLLERVGEVEHGQQLVRAPVRDPQEVASLEPVADRDHRAILQPAET
jgi:hypothetical protein